MLALKTPKMVLYDTKNGVFRGKEIPKMVFFRHQKWCFLDTKNGVFW